MKSRDARGRWAAGDDWQRWRSLVRVGPECWLWQGRRTVDGYPLFDIKAPDGGWSPVRAHRWAWEQTHGPLAAGWTLDHDCHTRDLDCHGGPACPHRACVRPDHLVPVTNAENLRRAHARRRARTQRGDP